MSKDKRLTVRQTVKEIQYAYDYFEEISRETLREMGLDTNDIENFEQLFAEKAAAACIQIEADMRRRLSR